MLASFFSASKNASWFFTGTLYTKNCAWFPCFCNRSVWLMATTIHSISYKCVREQEYSWNTLQRTYLEKETPVQREGAIHPDVKFEQCPIMTSMGVLGKKWTMLILRDIGFRKIDRFNRLLESIPGLTPRVLSKRLKELEKEGFIECIEYQKSPRVVRRSLS